MPLLAVSRTITVPGPGGFKLRGPWTVTVTDRAAATAGSGRHVTLSAQKGRGELGFPARDPGRRRAEPTGPVRTRTLHLQALPGLTRWVPAPSLSPPGRLSTTRTSQADRGTAS